MGSIFDAVVLDWWMFTKTDIFGLLIKTKTGRTPAVIAMCLELKEAGYSDGDAYDIIVKKTGGEADHRGGLRWQKR